MLNYTTLSSFLPSLHSFLPSFNFLNWILTFPFYLSLSLFSRPLPHSQHPYSLLYHCHSPPPKLRCFLEGNFYPPVSTHGTPRRTIVIALTQASSLMLEYGCTSLGRECSQLAVQRFAQTNKYSMILYYVGWSYITWYDII